MAALFPGIGAAQDVIGDHHELRHFQRPQRRLAGGLGDRRPQQDAHQDEQQVHRKPADAVVDPVDQPDKGDQDLRHGLGPVMRQGGQRGRAPGTAADHGESSPCSFSQGFLCSPFCQEYSGTKKPVTIVPNRVEAA
jgi:hypothetical protein